MLNLIKANLKYVIVIGIIALTFGLSKGIPVPATSISENKCDINDKLANNDELPQISSKDNFYRLNNIFNSAPGDYYRLSFEYKSNKDAKVDISSVSFLGGKFPISSLIASKSKEFSSYEILFKSEDKYRDLIFNGDFNENEKDTPEIFFRNVSISRLNIKNDFELSKIRKTIVGDTQVDIVMDQQIEEKNDAFVDLKNNDAGIGQVFLAKSKYLTGISFLINKHGVDDTGVYRIELRKAKKDDGSIQVSSQVLTSRNFPVKDLEKYSDDDGISTFPIFGILEENQYYYIGINNSSVKNNAVNYLELRGTTKFDAYKDGAAVVRMKKKDVIVGDLYFTIRTAKFNEVNGDRILTDAKIEDLGSSLVYKYKENGQEVDLLDIESYTYDGNIDFNGSLFIGKVKQGANYIYKISTIYPFRKIHISAEQASVEWKKSKIYYSLDKNDWHEIAYTQKEDFPQIFDDTIEGRMGSNNLYLKITYDEYDNSEGDDKDKFGIRNLSIVGDLAIK